MRARSRIEELLRRRARQQFEVAELGRLALSGVRIRTLLGEAVKIVAETLGADRVAVLEVEGGTLRARASHGWDEQFLTELAAAGESSVAAVALASENPVVVDDLRDDARFVVEAEQIGATSALAFKIRGEGGAWGLMLAFDAEPRLFTVDDASFLRTVANVLALALERRATENAMRERETTLRLALEAGQLGTWDWDLESREVRWSENLEQALGLPPGSFGGTVEAFMELVHPDDLERVRTALDAALEGGAGYDVEFRYVRPDGTTGWISTQGDVLRDEEGSPVRMLGLARDVTDWKRREESLEFLAEAGEALSASLDYQHTLAEVARLAVPRLADCCIVDVVEEGHDIRQLAVVHLDPEKEQLVEELERRWPSHPTDPSSFVGRVLRGRRPVIVEQMDEEFLRDVAQDEDHLAFLRRLRPGSAVFAPLTARGRTVGVITLLTDRPGSRFSSDHVALAVDLARHAALAVDNSRLYQQRTNVATTLQRSLLPPELPSIPGVQLAARYRAAGEGLEVGGDFYDAFAIDEARWGIAIGDVCGKGVEAAAVTGLTRHTIRAASLREAAPAAILAALNEAVLREYAGSTFCTVVLGVLEAGPARGGVRFCFACGGHPRPLVLRADARVEPIGCFGTLVGVFPDPELEEVAATLAPGETVLLYTDGLAEGLTGALDAGERRLADLLATCAALDAEAIAERIEEMVTDGGSAADRDDIAFIVLRAT